MRSWLAIVCCFLVCFGCRKKPEISVAKKSIAKHADGPISFDSARVLKYHYNPLTTIYRHYDYKTIWSDRTKRTHALELLRDAEKIGLDPKLYRYEALSGFEKNFDSLNDREVVHYDMLLTHSVRHLLSHACNGQVAAQKVHWNWALGRRSTPLNKPMIEAIETDGLSELLQSIQPKHAIYKGLISALKEVDAMADADFKKTRIGRKLKKGDSLAEVILLKKRLMDWGDMHRDTNISAVWNTNGIKSLMRFQRRNGLPVSGGLTPATLEELNRKPSEKRKQIVANLERWRWFPPDFGNQYVLVNIPAYLLYYVKDTDTVFRRIVVGKADRRTPVLISRISEVIFNPTWTIPPTIIKEDLGPDAAKDTNYFHNRRLTIYDWKNNLIPPSKWNPEKPNNYRYVQAPGSDNSLGNVKFNFPNNFMVYLHDTNHRDYFSRHKRSLSSGCVRVDNPLPFAERIIDDELWNLEKINEVVASKETTSVWLKKKIPIYQLYWTAWVNEDGRLESRPDIYGLDQILYKALRK